MGFGEIWWDDTSYWQDWNIFKKNRSKRKRVCTVIKKNILTQNSGSKAQIFYSMNTNKTIKRNEVGI